MAKNLTKLRAVIIGLMPLLIYSVPIEPNMVVRVTGTGELACGSQRFDGTDIELESCHKKDRDRVRTDHRVDTNSRREGAEVNDESKQKYRVKIDDTCPIGLEAPSGCDSNPDAVLCDDGSRPRLRLIYLLGGPRDGQLLSTDTLCPNEPVPLLDIPNDQVIVEEKIVVSPAEFRKFPIKSFSVHSDPDGVSLIRAYTHFWAEGGTQEFHTVMSGKNVDVRAIPVEWLWDYGDGTTARFSDPGGPVGDRSLSEATPTSHQFQDTGLFQVKVTTMYRGEFRVENGPWEPIPGQAAVPSDQSPMDIWRTKKQLVDPNV
ncbi:PKD domain-containing protein [Glutamicibacter endophyticus]|uniref:PKD domain-containing protein n=1 Tax=Glutamicibacter endophyticus TaxID=1522174 RepID=UPI003AF15A71